MADGRPIAVTASARDQTIRVWNVADGQPVGQPLVGAAANITKLATTFVEGDLHALTAVLRTGVQIWDLTTGRCVATRPLRYGDEVGALATAEVGGRALAVVGRRSPAQVWNVAAGGNDGPLLKHPLVYAASITTVGDRPVAVTGGHDLTVRVWDPATGEPIGPPRRGHTGWVSAMATAVVDGTTVAVTGSYGFEGSLRTWDLSEPRLPGRIVSGHTGWVGSVATTVVDGRPVAATANVGESEVRIWDLREARRDGPVLAFANDVTALAAAPGGFLVVCSGRDVSVLASDR